MKIIPKKKIISLLIALELSECKKKFQSNLQYSPLIVTVLEVIL